MLLEKLTRSQAAEYMHALDNSKSVAQWFTFLNDNARDDKRGKQPKIEFIKDLNNVSLYSRSELDSYIHSRKELRKEKELKVLESRTAQIKKAFGTEDPNNQNKYGQCFGYRWQGASINIVADNMQKNSNAAAIQLIINHPLRASALSLNEAKALTQELIDVIAYLDKSYEPTRTVRTTSMRRMIL